MRALMWTLDPLAAVPHWRLDRPPGPESPGFSTRRGGVSAPPFDTLNLGKSTDDDPAAVAENRTRFLAVLRASPEKVATAGQVHGARVVEVAGPGHTPECDALVTRAPGVALSVTTADCMGILYAAPGAVGAAHSGWRGAVAGMPVAALDAVRALAGCSVADVRVHFGPCIRGCCYAVGDEVASRFPAEALRRDGGETYLDLPTAARLALLGAGLPASAVHDTGACTACEPYWYFSHRRDRGRTGRQWGTIVRNGSVEGL